MNYKRIYENIINNAKMENREKLKKSNLNYVYYENHHIFPISLGGLNISNNEVLLTAKEHYICHKLLVKIYPCREMALAIHKMTYGNNYYNNTARDYEYARELISKTPIPLKTREKISNALSGSNNPMFGKPGTRLGIKDSVETKKKKSNSKMGEKNPQWNKIGFATDYKFNEEQRNNVSIAQKKRFSKKENHPRYGKKLSEETKNKISKALKK